MEAEKWKKAKEIFSAALEVAPEQRRLVISSACDGDDELRREVESLIKSHEESDEFYDTPLLNISAVAFADAKPERVGAYKIERELGRGGMGAVYLASRDDEQFKKQVAVKFILNPAANREGLRRFRDERQILAALEHPNIARLLDGGTTEGGLPYLVMEYVDGAPLTDFCSREQCSIDERLKIFLKICAAVSYAHQHLVIHRDLKPSNILVTNDGEPKLLDFGIAKLNDPNLTGDQTETLPMNRLLTPEYASPEQVRGDQVSTASDIYSLGVVLYQLLTGATPFRLKNKGFDEIARIISETDPVRPSAVESEQRAVSGEQWGKDSGRWSVVGGQQEAEESKQEAASREQWKGNKIPATGDGGQRTVGSGLATNPKSKIQNLKSLRGDLDNIVLMAMRKEPARRYRSVEQFAEDIRRHQAGLPVIAREDTFSYRAGKFIKRHRVGVTAAALVALALLGGLTATLWQWREARAQAQIAAAQRDRAQTAQIRAERTNDFLKNMFASAAPKNAGREVKVVEVLAGAERQARAELADQPEILAAILSTIGSTYNNLAQHEPAARNLRDALALYVRFPDENEQIAAAECAGNLADVLLALDKPAEAEPFIRQAVEIQRRYRPETDKNLSISLIQLGRTLIKKGDDQAAEPILQEGLTLARAAVGEESEVALFALNQLAIISSKKGDYADVSNIYRQIIPILRKNPAAKSNLAVSLTNLSDALVETGNFPEAEALLQEALQSLQAIYGDENVYIANTYAKLARLRVEQSRYAEAVTEAEKALAMQKKFLPPTHQSIAFTLRSLGSALTKTGSVKEGEKSLRDALAIALQNNRPESWQLGNLEIQLGENLRSQNRRAEAEILLKQGYEKLNNALGQNHPLTVKAFQRIN